MNEGTPLDFVIGRTNTISGSNPRDVVYYSLVKIEVDTVALELDRRGYKIM